MRVLVCVKRVPLTGGAIVLTDDGQAIDTRHLGFTISPHEECGVERYPLGREPITLRDGTPLTDAKGRRSYVTSAGAGPSLGTHILLAYLPPEHAVEGSTNLAIEYMTERYPVTVAAVGARPLFDPENTRIRS